MTTLKTPTLSRCSTILLLVGSFLTIGCSGGFEGLTSDSNKSLSDLPTVGEVNIEAAEPGDVAAVTKVTGTGDLFLGDTKTITFEYTVASDISGPLRLSVDQSALAGVQGIEDVSFAITPASVVATPGMVFTAALEITTLVKAPSFSEQSIQVLIEGDSGNAVTTTVPLAVSPVLEIRMYACDYRNNATLDECWNRPASMDLRAHAQQIQLRFHNCDPASGHIVHGNNPIEHGDRSTAMAAANSKEDCGGMHIATVEGDSTRSGTYYFHDTQNTGQARMINFGIASPLNAKVASVADAFDRDAEDTGGTCNH